MYGIMGMSSEAFLKIMTERVARGIILKNAEELYPI